MKTIPNAKYLLPRLWSVRLATIAAILSSLEVAVPLLPVTAPQGLFATLATLAALGTILARILAQPGISEPPQ